MRTRAIVVLSVVAFVALLIPQTHGRPYRLKRQTDILLNHYITRLNKRQKVTIIVHCAGLFNITDCGRRRRRSLEVLLQELRSPSAQGGPDAYPVLTDNNENEEDAGEFIASHQSLPEFLHRVQI
ncbi:uncharacterized protein LOC111873097 isoform X2 [Cryptotermes secundus]|uniref:uncharacterized protein LOC111873097 isoform X2 n=1 Tax=Cryptotermes secundus TaxID=105785 RepID=UPI000CD7C5DF|nr:uncharacterized protein LOC111873097 isoform X2 [Cryptotermes secundus]